MNGTMFCITDNYRFSQLTLITILALIFCSSGDLFAYEEKQERTINKRVWSIINGKVKLDKSSYSVEKVRISTPKVEQLKPPPPKSHERIPAIKLQKILISQENYKKKKFAKKEKRGSYWSSAQGSANSFLENTNAVSKFCNNNTTTPFCIRKTETHSTYYGTTPPKKPRKINLYDKFIFYKKHESNEFVQQLIEQSNR